VQIWNPIKNPKLLVAQLCLLLCGALPLQSWQTGGPPGATENLRALVQSFYDWYVPKAQAQGPVPAWVVAVREKEKLFSPELASALREDFSAQSSSPGEIVGLDFDPFLYSQDPDDRYETGRITRTGQSYRVEVYGISARKRSDDTSVGAELTGSSGHWRFRNFYYPQGRDLLTILASLRKSREKNAPANKR
jgi:hypothetical protein